MTRGRWLAVAGALIVVAVVLLVVRCVGGPDGGPAATALPPAHDPPATFEVGAGVALPRDADADPLPIVLQGVDAVIGTTDGLQVVDTRAGRVLRTVPALAEGGARPPGGSAPGAEDSGTSAGTPVTTRPTGKSAGTPVTTRPTGKSAAVEVTGSRPAVPYAAPVAGRPAVVAAFGVGVAGHGTTVGHPAVQVLTVDATSFDPVARVRIDLPASLSDSDRLREVRIVGADAGLLLVVARRGADEAATSYAVDPTTGRVAWERAGFDAAAVVAHRVVGVQSLTGGSLTAGYRAAALNAGDGAPAWTGAGGPVRSAAVWPAGPALVAVTTTDAGAGGRTLTLLDAVTGAVRTSRPVEGGVTCRFDERDVTVCGQGGSGQAWAAGFDAVTGAQLWELPDAAAGRVAPEVGTAWHGVVYGRTENGPVALDARTGTDRPVQPGIVPALVNAYGGVVAATLSTPHPVAYPAAS